MAAYIATTLITVTATVADRDGAPADPTTLVWTVRAPDGTAATPPSTAHPHVGVYELDIRLDQPGRYRIEAQADGSFVVAGDLVVIARRSIVDTD